MNQKLTMLFVAGVVALIAVALFIDYSSKKANSPEYVEQPPTEITPVVTRDYIGLTEIQAELLAEENATLFRVVERDGQPQMTTRDYRPGRINAVVENEVVVSYEIEGEGTALEELSNGEDGDPNEIGNSGTPSDTPDEPTGDRDEIIGMTEAEAEAYAEVNNLPIRVGYRDGEYLPVTMDYRPGRITLQIESEIVTGYTVE